MKRVARSKMIVLAGIVVLTLGCASLTQEASAEPPKPGSPDETMLAQIPLTDLNEQIEHVLSVEPTLRDTSYAGASIDADTMTYTIYWKGEIPQLVSTILESAPANVEIQVQAANFSYGQLDAAMTELMDQFPEVVLDASFADDRNGIVAGVEPEGARLPAVIDGVPVTTRESAPTIAASANS